MSFSHDVADLVAASNDSLHAAADWWQRIPLGEVCDILNGFPFQSHYFNDSQGAPIIRIRDVTSGACATFYSGAIPEGYWVEPSDMVVGMDGDFNCRLWPSAPGLLNQRVCKLIPHEDFLDKEFLSYSLPGYLRLINDHTHSITVKHLSSKTIAEIPFPLPPRAEQRRLVAKLNSLFERTRRAREELSHIPRLIENYKKAILEAAFRGDLVKATPYQDWKTRRIEEISKVGTGATPKRGIGKYYDNGTIPWVTSGAVNQQKIESAEEYITQSALDETNCKVFPSGTLLVAMYGEGLTRGKVAILEIDAATNQALAAIQLEKNDLVSNEYLFWFLQSNYLALRALAAGGVQPNLNLGIIKGIQVPIPPLDDQQLIVEKIKSAMDWLKIVDSEQEQAAHLLTYLDQANLAKAFRGELVHQEPNDEPASVLLYRIRGQRAGETRSKRGRRGSAATAQEAMA
jgi:type I restriction enzyme S subunit